MHEVSGIGSGAGAERLKVWRVENRPEAMGSGGLVSGTLGPSEADNNEVLPQFARLRDCFVKERDVHIL